MPIDEKTLVYVHDAIDEEFLKKFFVYLYSLLTTDISETVIFVTSGGEKYEIAI